MKANEVAAVLAAQDGVIPRRQLLACAGDHDIERLLRRREWARIHPGVYVDHTGPPSWRQRSWAAVLAHEPAALADQSALYASGLGDEPDVIDIVVAGHRRVVDPPGVRTRRLADFDSAVLANLSPPRMRVEHAAIARASRAATADLVVAVLGDACQRRRTQPKRLLAVAHAQPRLRNRRLMLEVLADIAAGTNSALERRYLVDVERTHGLPQGTRQLRVVDGKTTTYRDVDYDEQDTALELDGRLGHDGTADRWDDLDRDIMAAEAGDLTVRAGWRQVLSPCRLAATVGRILIARGWDGPVVPCGADCPARTAEDLRRQAPKILR